MKYGLQKLSDEWLPIYTLPSVGSLSLTEIWEEWTSGLNGCLSVWELKENWAAQWQRDVSGQKTEMAGGSWLIRRLLNHFPRKQTRMSSLLCGIFMTITPFHPVLYLTWGQHAVLLITCRTKQRVPQWLRASCWGHLCTSADGYLEWNLCSVLWIQIQQ